jgi:superfamily II DNA or RNA helicase
MTTITLLKLNEVHLRVVCDDRGIMQDLNDFFSFYMDGYMFSPKFKARIWDGKIRILNYATGKLPIGLITYVEYFAKLNNCELDIDPKLIDSNPISPQETKDYIDGLNLEIGGNKIIPRLHQYIGIHHALSKKRSCLVSPTSSGKSLIAYVIARYLKETTNKKVLIVVPTVLLVTQLYKDFTDYSSGNDFDVESEVHTITGGSEKNGDCDIYISTWQSISKLNRNYFEQFSGCIFDETHLLTGKSLQNISEKLTDASYRIGMTGTLVDSKANKLIIEGSTGLAKDLITTKELMNKGEVAKLKIDVQFLKYEDHICKGARQLDYQAEIKAICNYKVRTDWLSNMVLSKKNNSLVLFGTVVHGKEIHKTLTELTDRNVYLIYGNIPKEKREEIRIQMESEEDAILVASYQTLSTGVSIRNLHNIIFASPSKSKVRVLQSIGRGLRLHESKEHMTLIDVVDDMSWKKHKNYSLKHFIERQEHYNTSGFDYEITYNDIN